VSSEVEPVRVNCTEEGLVAKRRERISEHEAEVASRRSDLAEAHREGDQDDIRMREKKLDGALKELEKVKAE